MQVSAPPARHPTAAVVASSPTSRRYVLAVALVAAGWTVAQFALFGIERYVAWDEAVYLSQVAPDVPALPFHAHRAWGAVLVAAPVAWADVGVLRVYLTVLSGVALLVAFWPWSRLVGPVAPAAAALFAVTWGPMVLGSELYPNLLVALAAVAAAGWFVEHLTRGARAPLVGVAAGVAAVALLRPFDSVWLAAALACAMVVVHRRVGIAPLAALVAGGVAGWAPWVAEAYIRFGGLLERFQAAAGRSMGGVDRNNVAQYLNIVEGPVRRVVPDPAVTPTAALWVAGIFLLVALGVAQARRGEWRRPTATAALGAGLMLLPYLTVTGGINIRYLLPSYALACIPMAAAATAAWTAGTRGPGRVAARAGVVVLLVVWGVWQVGLASSNGAQLARERDASRELAALLDDRAGGRPCVFASEFAYPAMHYGSSCLGARLLVDDPGLIEDDAFDPDELAGLGWAVYALARSDPPQSSPLADWPSTPAPTTSGGWTLYEHPGSGR